MPIYEYKYKKKDEKSKKKKYFFSVYFTNALGERKKYRSEIFDDKDVVKAAEAKFILSQSERDTLVHSYTFDMIYDEYLLMQERKVRKITIEKIKIIYRYIKEYLGNVKINELTITKYQQWYNYIYKLDLSIRYKNRIFLLVQSLLRFSNTFYGITSNIPAKIGRFTDPNEFKKEMKFFSFDEFNKFINEVEEKEYKAFFTTLYFMGLRQGEAQALNWLDVDFEKNILKVRKTLTNQVKGESYTIFPPKTKSSNRELTMPQIVRNILLDLKSIYEHLDGFDEETFVFGMITPLARTTIQVKKNKACDRAFGKDKNRIRVHDFRHSFASLMINNGANITIVSKYLGHSDITQTLNTYTHMFPSKQQEIIDIIDRKLSQ